MLCFFVFVVWMRMSGLASAGLEIRNNGECIWVEVHDCFGVATGLAGKISEINGEGG